MKLTNLAIKDLITPEAKITFLAGAGCSIDAPSCLPAGRAMMDAIIDYTCAESEIEKIKKLEELRFEQLIEIVRDRLDPELKVIDFYGLCDKPNLQHLFLAEMIKNGQFVMTTNFDFLIEYALQQTGIPDKDIIPVITKKDFLEFQDPYEQLRHGRKTLYKIHGSTMNILKPIDNRDTRASLIATIQAFGANKEGETVFQLEPFKQPAFTNLTRGRSLVVMGYSGSDDFDIVPTLKVLKNVRDIIWINYSEKNEMGKEQIHEIDAKSNQALDELDKVTRMLLEIWQSNNADHVYRVDVNTTEMTKSLLKSTPKLSSMDFSIESRAWLENNLDVPNFFIKYDIPSKIYFDFGKYDDVINCSEKILQLAKNSQDIEGRSWEAVAHNNIGEIFRAQGKYSEALERYEKALQIAERIENLGGKAIYLNNIGMIYKTQGNYPEALERYEKALQIADQTGDLSGKAIYLNNIGLIYKTQGNYPEALKRLEKALQIAEQLGNLSGKATRLHNIGMVYDALGNYREALKRLEEALQIDEQLGNLSGKAVALNDIGEIFRALGNYSEALKRYEESLKISVQLKNLGGKASNLNNIGLILRAQGNYPEALKRFQEALQINEQLERLPEQATCINNIGLIYGAQGNFNEALKRHEKALEILINIGLGDSQDANIFKNNIKYLKNKLNL